MLTKTKSMSSIFLLNTILIVLVSIAGLSSFWISHEYRRFNNEVNALKDEYIKAQKLFIKEEVNRVIDYIQHERLHYDGGLKNLQAKLLNRINGIRYKKNQYISVNKFDGTILAHYKQENIGKNMLDFTDKNGVKAVQKTIEISKNEEGGYVTYVGSIKPSSGKPGEKLTYATSILDWGWVVSTGVYMDDIEGIVSARKTELINTLKSLSLKIIIIFFSIFVIIIPMTLYFSRKIKKNCDIFTSFFEQSAVSNVKINRDELQIEEFKILSDSANLMVDNRTKAETSLKESEKHLRSLMESATNFSVYRLVTDKMNPYQLKVKFVSPSIKDILGIPEPMKFETWFKSMHSEDVNRITEANKHAFKTLRFNEEYRTYNQKKNQWCWIHAISTGVVDKKRAVESVNGILFDITDHKNAEEELEEKTLALRRLNEKMVHIEHKERKIFASDLHDTVGQTLSISISKLKDIQELGVEGNPEVLAEVIEYLEHAINEIRGLIHRLSPPVLNDFGIDVALETLVDNHIEKYDMEIVYINNLDDQIHLNETNKIIVYRIVDELIVNIRKHSKSKSSEIEIFKKNNLLLIRIEDNGIGFDTEKLKDKNYCGFGIQSIFERLSDLNGRFEILSNPGKGTKILMYIPLCGQGDSGNE